MITTRVAHLLVRGFARRSMCWLACNSAIQMHGYRHTHPSQTFVCRISKVIRDAHEHSRIDPFVLLDSCVTYFIDVTNGSKIP